MMTTTSKMTTTWHPSHGRRADAVGMLVIRVLPLMLLSSSCSLVDAQSLSSAQNVGIDDVSGSDPTAVDWWRSINQTTTDYLGYHLDELYDWMVVAYVRPKHVGHVFLSCISFFVLMIALCYAVERTNPDHDAPGRKQQIKAEILESIPAVFASTTASLIHLNYLYPRRWGFEAPVFPSSPSRFALEFVYWMICFEIFVYVLHRFLHVRKPIDVYKHIHRAHHLFFFPSAFASQAIHPIEAILFAETSLIASVFLMPISVATQYICGILLLIWSIMAHDSRFFLDKGAHYEHHSHPQTNFGFMGFVDLFAQTVYWGAAFDDPSKTPPYISRWRPLHKLVFGKDPLLATRLEDESDFNEEKKKELAERRRRIMAERKRA